MTTTRWRERGIVAHWLKMAATRMIGRKNLGGKFRLVEAADGAKYTPDFPVRGSFVTENSIWRVYISLFLKLRI